ncbi:Glycosyltransferase, GT2 family [Actinopolyspora mzabensis]|uniref:Glycosyltransferase, GT2 family n=1 Tax=Actinopolyspora mzabensis TaxID=995066 RepID=A0A1G9D475_ACTMZ|nr:glycosyltransferase [Actinopolyspora mzabensis]SDK58643.1 Glycosyltransferase, GT2 family [Actinopolyspora mzabensis]
MAALRSAGETSGEHHPSTAPVLAVLVCRRGAEWLPEVLTALRRLTVSPRHFLAVEIGSAGEAGESLAAEAAPGSSAPGSSVTDGAATGEIDPDGADPDGADPDGTAVDGAATGGSGLLDGVLTVGSDTGFGAAVAHAVAHAEQRWGDPGSWLWLLRDDAAPEPDCLDTLLRVADNDSSAAVLGPLGLDRDDPRLIVDAGLSMDTSGRVRTGPRSPGLDPALGHLPADAGSALQVSEVLAVSGACALVRREVFDELGGFDEQLPPGCAEVDLGWRANTAGHLVLCVPEARMRRAVASTTGERGEPRDEGADSRTAATTRRQGEVRTYLANVGNRAYRFGVPRLVLLALPRSFARLVTGRPPEAFAELLVGLRLLTGRLRLRDARLGHGRAATAGSGLDGLLTGRGDRMRDLVLSGYARLVRNRVRHDARLGLDLSSASPARVPEVPNPAKHGPDALPSGALGHAGTRRRSAMGLRRPTDPVVIAVPEHHSGAARDNETGADEAGDGIEARVRPTPAPRDGAAGTASTADELLFVPVDRRRVLRELLLNPPLVLLVGLVLLALLAHGPFAETSRLGAELHGGRLLPAAGLEQTWSSYLAAWHPLHGGTGAPAPPTLLVLGLLGGLLAPFGGPPTAVALLLLAQLPLAGLSAYLAGRSIPVPRSWLALAAAAYALLPVAMAGVVQGRLDAVLAHVLLPPLLAGLAGLLGLVPRHGGGRPNWLGTACRTALAAAVLAAFAPGVYVLLVLLAVVGFLCPPFAPAGAVRRLAGLASFVLLPVACLLPWPVVALRHPELLWHGPGLPVTEHPAGLSLLALHPGDGAWGWLAVSLPVGAALLLLFRVPGRAALPGVVVACFGWGASLLVARIALPPLLGGTDRVGWAGGALLLTACGLLWVVLACVAGPRRWSTGVVSWRPVGAVAVVVLLSLALGTLLTARSGPLRPAPETSTTAGDTGYWLTLRPDAGAPRLTPRPRPRFGSASLAPAPGAVAALSRIQADLLSGEAERVRSGVAAAASRGAGRIALPEGGDSTGFVALSGRTVAATGESVNGRRVFRVLLPHTPVTLLGPALARNAREDVSPRPRTRPIGISTRLPHVTIRVSKGGPGRVLLLAAQRESGWRAYIDGSSVGLATGWGEQVAVPLPETGGQVRIGFTAVPRTSLLACQAAAVLFTLIGAFPGRGRRQRDDSTEH